MGNENWEWPTDYHQVLRTECFPPRSAAFPSTTEDHRRSTLKIWQICQFWYILAAEQVERHHFLLLAFRCAKITSSIMNRMASYPSILAHSYDIRIPVAAENSPSDPPELIFASDFTSLSLHRCRPILNLGEKKLGKAWRSAAIV